MLIRQNQSYNIRSVVNEVASSRRFFEIRFNIVQQESWEEIIQWLSCRFCRILFRSFIGDTEIRKELWITVNVYWLHIVQCQKNTLNTMKYSNEIHRMKQYLVSVSISVLRCIWQVQCIFNSSTKIEVSDFVRKWIIVARIWRRILYEFGQIRKILADNLMCSSASWSSLLQIREDSRIEVG